DRGAVPVFRAASWAQLEGFLETAGRSGHAAVIPHDSAKFPMNLIHGPLTTRGEELLRYRLVAPLGVVKRRMRDIHRFAALARQILPEGVRDDEVAVGEPLHES